MKKFKFAALFAVFVSVIGFSSCLDDSKSDTYDLYDYVTVVNDPSGMSAMKCMVGDMSGIVLMPSNEGVLSKLKLNDGSYYERAYVGVKFADGEEISSSKTRYMVSEITVVEALPYQSFNLMPDTLDAKGYGNHGFSTISKNLWAKTGFITVPFELRVTNDHVSTFYKDIHMYIEKASNDTLYTRMRYVRENMEGTTYQFLMSFKLPKRLPIYNTMRPKGDTIVVKVSAPYNPLQQVDAFTKCRYGDLLQ